MTRMLEIPANRPRRSRLLLPLVGILIALFYVAVQSESRDAAERGWRTDSAGRDHLPDR